MSLCWHSGKQRFESHRACLDRARERGHPAMRTYYCAACDSWHMTRGLGGEKDPSIIRAIGERSHVAGPLSACTSCGGALEVRGHLCPTCRGSGLRLAAA